jgi:hypothetical protein
MDIVTAVFLAVVGVLILFGAYHSRRPDPEDRPAMTFSNQSD